MVYFPSGEWIIFRAARPATGFRVAVEAKAKHRGIVTADQSVSAGVRGLLSDAAQKRGAEPFAVFVEMSLPPEAASRPPSWIVGVNESVNEVAKKSAPDAPFDLVVFTNLPHQYGLPGERDPERTLYTKEASTSRIPEAVVLALVQSVPQYGNVPNVFPDDFGESQTHAEIAEDA